MIFSHGIFFVAHSHACTRVSAYTHSGHLLNDSCTCLYPEWKVCILKQEESLTLNHLATRHVLFPQRISSVPRIGFMFRDLDVVTFQCSSRSCKQSRKIIHQSTQSTVSLFILLHSVLEGRTLFDLNILMINASQSGDY